MIYKKYKHAQERCNPNYKNKKNYYDRWIRFLWNSFEEFYNDMNDGYEKHCKLYGAENTTLDRINNDWHYCKENCRWATRKEQSRNKRRNMEIMYNGKVYWTVREFCEATGKNPNTISTRMNRDWMTMHQAISIPLNSLPKKWKSVEYKWRKFPSVSELCRLRWVNKNTVFIRMKREWMSLEEAIDTPINPSYKRN